MSERKRFPVALTLAGVAVGVLAGTAFGPSALGSAQAGGRVFEIRTYTTHDGKLDALNARFRAHTQRLFARHGITSVAYWTPTDAPSSKNTLIYVLAHPDRDAAKRNWDAFRADPEWQKARTASEANGPIVSKIESVFMQPTDYSPLK
jgi:hypothetical protein